MKTVSRLTFIMRVVGIVILCLALVLTMYSTIMAASPYKEVTDKLAEVNGEANLFDRIGFTGRYFDSLYVSANDKENPTAIRAQNIEPEFEKFNDIYAQGVSGLKTKNANAAVKGLKKDFDYAAYIEKASAADEGTEDDAIKEAYDFFDSLTTLKLPKGKANKINLNAGQAEENLPGIYEALVEEYGEENTGTYFEFVSALKNMLTDVNNETPIENTISYMQSDFDFDRFAGYLAAEKSEEKALANGFGEAFAAMAEDFAADGIDAAKVDAFLNEQYDAYAAEYGDTSKALFNNAVANLVSSPRGTDGMFASVNTEIAKIDASYADYDFKAFMTDFTRNIVVEADKRSDISLTSALWLACTYRLYLWALGIVLILLSVIIKKIYVASYMKKADFAEHKDDSDVLLRVDHLKQYFKSGDYVNKAVDDISFYIKKGEVFGLVGESGCGKTTTGRTIINLYDPTDGDVYFNGLRISSSMNGVKVMKYQLRKELDEALKSLKKNSPADYAQKAKALKKEYAEKLLEADKKAYESEEEKRRTVNAYRELRKKQLTEEYNKDIVTLSESEKAERKQRYDTEMKLASQDNIMTRMQMIFQDPIASINPRMTVREIIAEGLRIRGVKDQKYIDQKVYEMLELVGLVPEHADRYPHEFSGGQRQRIGIARAIVLEPELIIADEPISALDVSIQAQVINLLNELRDKMGLTILFIAHNLSVVKYFSDRIAVMYYGHIVEMATSEELFRHPLHPYTKSLLSAIPYPDPHYEKNRKRIEYTPATAHDYSVDKPSLREILPGHFIHCNDKEFAEYQEEIKR